MALKIGWDLRTWQAGCIAGGSLKLYDYFKEECARRGMDVYVGLTQENEMEDVTEPKGDGVYLKKSGCHGFCEMGPGPPAVHDSSQPLAASSFLRSSSSSMASSGLILEWTWSFTEK